MADVKISDLPLGTTPLDGTELVPLVQGGITKHILSAALQGADGTDGTDGRGIVSIVRTSGTGAAGTTDTYTITYTDATTSTFDVYNGADGVGAGDMLASFYDTNADGKVNAADVADAVPWTGVTGKPLTFEPSAHNHVIGDVTGLQTALDGKQPTGSYIVEGDTRLTDARTPTGTAGGVLSGTYPNPGFAVDMATQAELDTHTTNTSNPHSVTAAQVGADPTGTASAAVTAHEAAADPHSQYTTAAEAAAAAPVQSVAGQTGVVTLAKGDVGLGNVDNTADLDKPISTATQTALDAKQDTLVSGTSIKTINGGSLLGSGDITAGDVTLTGTQTLTNKTLSGAVLNDGYTEEVFAVTGTAPALSPANGSIQTWTLTGNSTPTAGTWAAGQSITLMIDDGAAYTITWTSLAVTWKTGGGTAPTLNTSGYTAIALWKVGTTIYGARVGDA